MARSKGSLIGWMSSGKLQRLVGEDIRWWDKLRGKGREGWMVQKHRWEANGGKAVAGRGIRGGVVGWYLPVRVADERALSGSRCEGGGADEEGCSGQASWSIHTGSGDQEQGEWCRHTISRKELVGITGRLVHADGQVEVLVLGGEVWEEWTGQAVEGTDWRKGAKDEWAANLKRGQCCGEVGSGAWIGIKFMTRGEQLVVLEKVEPWLLLAVVLSQFYFIIHFKLVG